MAQNQGMARFDPTLFRPSDNVVDLRGQQPTQAMSNEDATQVPQEPLDPEMAKDLEKLDREALIRMNQRLLDELRKSQPRPTPKPKPKPKKK